MRDGERIAFDRKQHWMIAKEFNLGKPLNDPEDDLVKRLVDDAGNVFRDDDGTLVFSDKSSTCRLRNPQEAKSVTKQVAEKITGQKVRIEL